jgi:twitching motility protein PilT
MADVVQYLQKAVAVGASDILVISGMPVSMRINGEIIAEDEGNIMPDAAEELVKALYALAGREMDRFDRLGDDDFPLSVSGLSRFRVSTYRQRGSAAAVIRVVRFDIPDYHALHIPEEVMHVADKKHGLVLVTGPTGCGKSTTLACVVDAINRTRHAHIITIEDPIEFLHRNKKSAISQREVGADTEDYVSAMRASLRQTPDVIQLGEMRDYETINAAVTAAETGLLVLSTLHTLGAANTVDRIIDVFPSKSQNQIRLQLSMTLQTVISQQLLPDTAGGQIAAFEIMHLNSAIRNMIRESKTHQIDSVIQTYASEGMIAMDTSIINLYRSGKITAETAVKYAMNPEQMEKKLK